MNDEEYNSQIEIVAAQIVKDRISLDEQDAHKLQKYYDYAKTNFHLENESATQLVNEAFLYLKLKTAKDLDPLQEGDKFGAGFS